MDIVDRLLDIHALTSACGADCNHLSDAANEINTLRADLAKAELTRIALKRELTETHGSLEYWSAEASRDATRLVDVAEVLAEFGLPSKADIAAHLVQRINNEDDLRDFAEALLAALEHPDTEEAD